MTEKPKPVDFKVLPQHTVERGTPQKSSVHTNTQNKLINTKYAYILIQQSNVIVYRVDAIFTNLVQQ